MRKVALGFVLLLLTPLVFMLSGNAGAQIPFSSMRAINISTSHHTVGTSTAAQGATVGGNVISWKICNDAVNTSTYLLVGKASDVSTDGVMLGKGACFECWNCKASTLSSMRCEGQAASNGYSVIQYRQ